MFGLCATALLTDIIQLSTGYHAPFFLTVCKPNYTLAGVSCDKNAYITTDICSGQDEHAIMAARCLPYFLFVSLFEVFRLIIEACFVFFCFSSSSYRKTFPSQHATLSAFAAVYVSVSATKKTFPQKQTRVILGPVVRVQVQPRNAGSAMLLLTHVN